MSTKKSIQQILDEQKHSEIYNKTSRQISAKIDAEYKKNDPEFSKTMRKIAAERNRDPEYLKKLHAGIANRDNTYQSESNNRPEVKEKISSKLKGKIKTPEHLANVAKKNKERSKTIQTPYGQFPSRKAAVEYMTSIEIGNAGRKLDRWLKEDPTNFYYT
jgi:hypothetical protein